MPAPANDYSARRSLLCGDFFSITQLVDRVRESAAGAATGVYHLYRVGAAAAAPQDHRRSSRSRQSLGDGGAQSHLHSAIAVMVYRMYQIWVFQELPNLEVMLPTLLSRPVRTKTLGIGRVLVTVARHLALA
jgi:hypothetical protein